MSDTIAPPQAGSVPSYEAIHVTIEAACSCGTCAAQAMVEAAAMTLGGGAEAGAGAPMPALADIVAGLQFELNLLSDDTLNTTGAAPHAFTYQFEDSQPADLPTSTVYTGWTPLTVAEKAAVRAAMDLIESVINVTFTEVTGDPDPDINLGKVDLTAPTAGFGGFSYGATSFDGGTTWELSSYDGYAVYRNDIDLTTNASLILHELGHALTLKHPFETPPLLDPAFDNNKWTLMSYTPNPQTGGDGDGLQLFDIAALQDRWGENDGTNDGATRYTGSRTANTDVIWDVGGRADWLDAQALATDVVLNLNPGEFSRFGAVDDVVIAFGVQIENARGGRGDDTITGNDQGNKLYGGTGDDTILGGGGKDTIIGNNGADILRGGDKEDYLNGGKGNDMLYGDNQRDVLFGSNGRDTLDGGQADDTLEGGRGNDTFIFRSGGDSDTIIDFENDRDRVLFDIDGITSRAQVAGFINQDGADVVYDFGGGDVLRILNMTVADMADDFNVI